MIVKITPIRLENIEKDHAEHRAKEETEKYEKETYEARMPVKEIQ